MGFLTERGSGVGQAASSKVQISTSIDIIAYGRPIAFAQNIDETSRRTADRIRHLSIADAGRVIEQAPGVEDIDLSLSGFAVYNEEVFSLLNQLGHESDRPIKCLNDQKIPFDIIVKTTHPATGETVVDVYGDCVMVSYSRPRNIGTITISDRVDVQASWKE